MQTLAEKAANLLYLVIKDHPFYDEFEVEKAVAAADLDALLAKLKEYGVISED